MVLWDIPEWYCGIFLCGIVEYSCVVLWNIPVWYCGIFLFGGIFLCSIVEYSCLIFLSYTRMIQFDYRHVMLCGVL